MSEYAQYYQAFTARLAHGEGLTPDQCRCHGGGWILSDVDTWHKCPDHYVAGTPNPEDEPLENEAACEALAPVAPPAEVAGLGADDDEIPF